MHPFVSRLAVLAAACIALSCAHQAPPKAVAPTVVLSTIAFKPILDALQPSFERSGQSLRVQYAVAAEMKSRIEKGEAFDATILTVAALDDLVKQGRVAADSRAVLARSGAGVATRKGAPKPDLSSPESFRKALLDAKSIVYSSQGATGPNMKRIFEKFGIAEQMAAKTKVVAAITAPQAVARGEAEMGFTQVSEILDEPTAEFAGPLPAGVQVYTTFAGGTAAKAANPAGARALMSLLASADATRVLQAKGMDRP